MSSQMASLLKYMEDTWVKDWVWTSRDWSVYNMTVITNNDVWGWHTCFNYCGKWDDLPFYVLIDLLARVKICHLSDESLFLSFFLDCLIFFYKDLKIIYEALNHVIVTPFLCCMDFIFSRLNWSWRENSLGGVWGNYAQCMFASWGRKPHHLATHWPPTVRLIYIVFPLRIKFYKIIIMYLCWFISVLF